ncbi:MAG: hypothetical protein FWF49_06065, partial [Oscillospiraceae bacterium]|nr:hypothetical protein [Oscillospiraceae bacterium]
MCKKITTIALSALSVVLAGALLWSQLDFYRYRRRTDDTLSRNAATIAAQAATIDASIPTSLVLDIAVRYALNPDALQKLFTDRLFYYDDTGVAWAPIDPSLPQNPLDFSLVQNEDNGLKTYSDTNGVQGMQGIDVSSYQGAIQWDKVKAAGIDFAVIRVGVRGWGDGALHLDTQFVNNIKGAQKAGVQIGLYFYSAAINTAEAAAEADFVLAQIKRYNISVTFPVA